VDRIPWDWTIPMILVALGVALVLRPVLVSAAEKGELQRQQREDERSRREAEQAQKAAEEEEEPGEESGVESEGEEDPLRAAFREEEERDRLRRSRRDRVLLGVCGGLARRFDADSTLVRVLFAFVTIYSFGLAVVAYLLLALLMPEEPARPEPTEEF
jgi:phage shock protein C